MKKYLKFRNLDPFSFIQMTLTIPNNVFPKCIGLWYHTPYKVVCRHLSGSEKHKEGFGAGVNEDMGS